MSKTDDPLSSHGWLRAGGIRDQPLLLYTVLQQSLQTGDEQVTLPASRCTRYVRVEYEQTFKNQRTRDHNVLKSWVNQKKKKASK